MYKADFRDTNTNRVRQTEILNIVTIIIVVCVKDPRIIHAWFTNKKNKNVKRIRG